MSSVEECIPCSPGRVTELITQRAGGTRAARAGNASRGDWGAGDPAKPQPHDGRSSVLLHALRAKPTRPGPCVV